MANSVLFIDNTIAFGGALISLKNLIKALDKNKYKPLIITGQSPDFINRYFPNDISYTFNIKLPWVHNSIYKSILSRRFFNIYLVKKFVVLIRMVYWILFHDFPDALRFYKIGKKYDVKIVHLNNILGSQFSGILAAKMLRVPCVAHLRDFDNISYVTRCYAKMINHHIAISSVINKNLLDLGIPEKRISIVHDSIDLDDFDTNHSCEALYKEYGIKRGTKIFGIFGRIVQWKGIREFVLASSEVFKKVPEACAFIVGDSTEGGENYFQEIRDLVHGLNLEKKIIFTGYQSDVPKFMKFMDVIVHASITPEPFGMVVIEGMAMGKPVIAAAAGGPLDIIENGRSGILVDPMDRKAFADSIVKVLNDSSLAKALGASGRKRVEKRFSNEKSAEKIETIYENLISGSIRNR